MRDKIKITNMIYGRVPPQATELEEAVLGALILQRDCLAEALGAIQTEEVFYLDSHMKIFFAIKSLFEEGATVDLLTITQYLRDKGELEIVGGVGYLAELTMNVVSSAHVSAHTKIIIEKYLKRELIRLSGIAISEAYEDGDVFEIHDNIVRGFNKSFDLKNSTNWTTMQAVGKRFLEKRERSLAGIETGISTTIKKLDDENGGFKAGQFIIGAAHTSVGKSAWLSQVILKAAKEGLPVGIISVEMLPEEQYGRMISQDYALNNKSIDTDESLSSIIHRAVQELSSLPIYFFDKTNVDIREIVSGAEYLKNKHDIKLLAIDYLQLINVSKTGSRERELADISRQLKTLSMMLGIPVIALSQLNDDSEKRPDKKPKISDLRECKAMGHDADAVILIHRDYRAGIVVDGNNQSTYNDVDIIVPKWRNGTPCMVKYGFKPETMTFYDPSEQLSFTFDEPAHKSFTKLTFNDDKPFG